MTDDEGTRAKDFCVEVRALALQHRIPVVLCIAAADATCQGELLCDDREMGQLLHPMMMDFMQRISLALNDHKGQA